VHAIIFQFLRIRSMYHDISREGLANNIRTSLLIQALDIMNIYTHCNYTYCSNTYTRIINTYVAICTWVGPT